MKPLAVFFVYIWPEPKSSAAGLRSLEVLTTLLEHGWQVKAISSSKLNQHSEALNKLGIETYSIAVNDSNECAQLQQWNPSLVIFDRFVMEEQFGWRAREMWPNALRVIDTQDLHFVRRTREAHKNLPFQERLDFVIDGGDDFLRELSAFYRSDGVLVLSEWEYELLTKRFSFPKERLLHWPLFGIPETAINPMSERRDFAFLGNFRHPPNADGIRWVKEELWPAVRMEIPSATLHLYGAYPPAEISASSAGLISHGPVDNHRKAIARHRALLAPLRFGAGIKGKVIEAWCTGTPVIGTPFSFEGMGEIGLSFRDQKGFVQAIQRLDAEAEALQAAGITHVKKNFSPETLKPKLCGFLAQLEKNKEQLRKNDTIGRMLRYQHHNSTKYFSRWIEEKNKHEK